MRDSTIRFMLAAIVLGVLTACAPAAPAATPIPAAKATPAAAIAAPTPVPATPTPAPAKPTATPAPAPVKLKLGTTWAYTDIGFLMAMEKGFFAEQGITLEVTNFPRTDDMIAPLGTGELDVGALLVSPAALNAKDRGIDLRAVLDKSTSRPNYEFRFIMLRKDLADSGQVKSPADLKGMKVSIMSRGGGAHQTAELMLAKGVLTEKDLAGGAFEILAPPDNIPAFANKAISAAFMMDPFATAAVQQGLATKWIATWSLFPGNSAATSLLAYSPKLAKDVELGRRWMVAYLKGIRYYYEALKTKQGKDEVWAAVAKYTPIKDPKVFEGMEPVYLDPNGTVDMASLKFQYDWLVKTEAYKGKTTFADLVDTSFVEYAVQKLGRQ